MSDFFWLQALKLLHHSPEFLPFVVFLSSPGSTALRNQLTGNNGTNHVSNNGQNGAPGILSSVWRLSFFLNILLILFLCPTLQSILRLKLLTFFSPLFLYPNPLSQNGKMSNEK